MNYNSHSVLLFLGFVGFLFCFFNSESKNMGASLQLQIGVNIAMPRNQCFISMEKKKFYLAAMISANARLLQLRQFRKTHLTCRANLIETMYIEPARKRRKRLSCWEKHSWLCSVSSFSSVSARCRMCSLCVWRCWCGHG